ncbi:MAG TPA: HAEPLYID family protein, partial [Flavobacteriaceae bacterium]|nr:HAEPLYID family protein [Flavobacteriaceae bacterium]
ATSMALGYIHEFELSSFRDFGKPFITGNVYNPFFVVAKRWGNNFHSLVYTGPMIEHHLSTNATHTTYGINTNLHYMISGTRNFIGIEFNKTLDKGDFDMTLRPQMRVGIADNLLIGIVTGIPVARENQRFSTFLRLIWEPPHK